MQLDTIIILYFLSIHAYFDYITFLLITDKLLYYYLQKFSIHKITNFIIDNIMMYI